MPRAVNGGRVGRNASDGPRRRRWRLRALPPLAAQLQRHASAAVPLQQCSDYACCLVHTKGCGPRCMSAGLPAEAVRSAKGKAHLLLQTGLLNRGALASMLKQHGLCQVTCNKRLAAFVTRIEENDDQ